MAPASFGQGGEIGQLIHPPPSTHVVKIATAGKLARNAVQILHCQNLPDDAAGALCPACCWVLRLFAEETITLVHDKPYHDSGCVQQTGTVPTLWMAASPFYEARNDC